MKRWRWPLTVLALVLAIFAVLDDWTPARQHGAGWDEGLLAYVVGIYLIVVTGMLINTPRWSSRALGLLCTMLADVVFFGLIAWGMVARQHPWLPAPPSQAAGDAIRAFLIIGGTLLVFALLRYWWSAIVGVVRSIGRFVWPPRGDKR